jgi:uncharacterized protein involved in exopolysaccharide biosynthesis
MEEMNIESAPPGSLVVVRKQDRALMWSARDLLASGFRHKKLLISCFLGILLMSVLASLLRPQKYESEAKILVKHERADPLVTPGAERIQREYGISEEELHSEAELIGSDDLLRKVVLTCGLARPAGDQHGQQRNIAEAVDHLRSRLKVNVIRKTNILSVAYSSPSPELSARVVDAVVSSYLEKHVAVHSSSDLGFFDLQVGKYYTELGAAQAGLNAFSQGKDGAVSPAEQRDALLQKQSEFNAMLQQSRSQISETEARIRSLQREAEGAPDRVTTQVRNSDNPHLLQDLKATMLKLELRRTDLVSKYKSDYPPLQELNEEIAETKAALASAESSPLHDQTTDVNPVRLWIDSELAKAQAELRSLQSRAENLSSIVGNYNRQARFMDGQQLRYEDLARNAKSAEENYLLYVRKREEARISNALDQSRILNVTVIEPATHPYLPTSSGASYLLMSLMLSFAVTAGLLFTLEHADNTFRTPHQLEQYIHVPVLATVPLEQWDSSGTPPQASQGAE